VKKIVLYRNDCVIISVVFNVECLGYCLNSICISDRYLWLLVGLMLIVFDLLIFVRVWLDFLILCLMVVMLFLVFCLWLCMISYCGFLGRWWRRF